jgi:hypothetical protein
VTAVSVGGRAVSAVVPLRAWLPEPVTYVFRGELAAVNRALDDAGFRAEALAPAARIPHDAGWADRLASVLGG